jgi:hypothetical protein
VFCVVHYKKKNAAYAALQKGALMSTADVVRAKTIVTHTNPDLDAVLSTWATKRMNGWEEATIVLRPSNWQGTPSKTEVVVDMDAGLKDAEIEGVRHCASYILCLAILPRLLEHPFRHIVNFVDIGDMHGDPISHLGTFLPANTRLLLRSGSLHSAWGALRRFHGKDQIASLRTMHNILDGLHAHLSYEGPHFKNDIATHFKNWIIWRYQETTPEASPSALAQQTAGRLAQSLMPSEHASAMNLFAQYIDRRLYTEEGIKQNFPKVPEALRTILVHTSIQALWEGLRWSFNHDAETRLFPLFDEFLAMGLERSRAEIIAQNCPSLAGGLVRINSGNKERQINGMLFHAGALVVIFQNRDGTELGALRNKRYLPDTVRLDDPLIREVIKSAGESVGSVPGTWFVHPSGFLMARGTRKAPAKSPSRVRAIEDLGPAYVHLLEKHGLLHSQHQT